MKMLFVNYINSKSPKIALQKYLQQHRIFVTSLIARQPGAIASLISGETEGAMFVEALEKLRENKKKFNCPTLYLDNDCIMMNPVDTLFNWDFDVAVVYRFKWEAHGGRQDCLGGFLFFSGKRPDVEDYFLDFLIEHTKKRYDQEIAEGRKPWYYDQLAINDLVGAPPIERSELDYRIAKPYTPCTKEVMGVKVLYLSANEWACPMTIYVPKNIKLIHYNHAHWPIAAAEAANGKSVLRSQIQPAPAVPQV